MPKPASRHLRYWARLLMAGATPQPGVPHPDVCRSRLQCTSRLSNSMRFLCSERPSVFIQTRNSILCSRLSSPLFPIGPVPPMLTAGAGHVSWTMSKIPGRRQPLLRAPPSSGKAPCRPQSWTLPHSLSRPLSATASLLGSIQAGD